MVRGRLLGILIGVLASLTACHQDMFDQSRTKPLSESRFFADGRSARPALEDTVARGALHSDSMLETGKVSGSDTTIFPLPVTREVLDRGQERFDIFCSPCHGRTGEGNGMIVQRGFKPPPSFHIDRLRQAPVGHYFDVITNGFGTMYSYSSRISAEDRWAVIAYVRALQLSRSATIADVPPAEQARLGEAK